MAGSKIKEVCLEEFTERTGILGRKTVTEERIRMTLDRGAIYLRESAVSGTGDSWKRVKNSIRLSARQQGIPTVDRRKPKA